MTAVEGLSTWHLALIGTPNSGKTALFNALTGSHQKVANYPGVTVERKAGALQTPAGRSVNLIDLPGTYSLRGRSPDEEITRDFVLGRLATEPKPDLLLCVADATNLRLALRLVIELKRVGRPMMLVLNMFDIATRRGVKIDLKQLSAELGVPVVTSVAVRRGGTEDLLRQMDEMAANTAAPDESSWKPPTASELRAAQREADRILRAAVAQPAPDTLTGKLDAVLLHPVAGLVILLAILFVMFQAVFAWAKPVMDLIAAGFDGLGVMAHDALPAGLLQSFIQNGVISGVGSVLVFLPQILILFLFINLLEDTGYLARAAFLVDRAMRSVGLSGQSVIPLLSSFACAVPSIMATRVIPNRRDRIATILAAPFMTCSARLPVYALLIGAFVPAQRVGIVNLQGLVLFGLYAIGIVGGVATALLLRSSVLRGENPTFILALPEFRLPNVRTVGMKLLDRVRVFLHRAGTIIFAVAVVVWALTYFPRAPEIEQARAAAEVEARASLSGPVLEQKLAEIGNQAAADHIAQSWLGRAGHWVEPAFRPLGWDWRVSAAVIAGFPAREVVVAVLGTIYAVGEEADEQTLAGRLTAAQHPNGAPVFTLPMVLGLLLFYAWCLQCAATLAVIRRETNSWRWPLFAWSYMTALGYGGALLLYQLGTA